MAALLRKCADILLLVSAKDSQPARPTVFLLAQGHSGDTNHRRPGVKRRAGFEQSWHHGEAICGDFRLRSWSLAAGASSGLRAARFAGSRVVVQANDQEDQEGGQFSKQQEANDGGSQRQWGNNLLDRIVLSENALRSGDLRPKQSKHFRETGRVKKEREWSKARIMGDERIHLELSCEASFAAMYDSIIPRIYIEQGQVNPDNTVAAHLFDVPVV
eukprot:CAMPEP_0183343120 /NCGR_PEP_ID=MMETSP0164_2-20130417/9097_1 /TAXON_ID=221442 /ORGANISM="Coccolithus pelagicus ssp braarudi, Strain PLY182g" /LENGTH=215 /DNA_ID=CAMNT_0025513875 /DNA_START=54 /DNA_END=702 /DNA_ORIENTATION=+